MFWNATASQILLFSGIKIFVLRSLFKYWEDQRNLRCRCIGWFSMTSCSLPSSSLPSDITSPFAILERHTSSSGFSAKVPSTLTRSTLPSMQLGEFISHISLNVGLSGSQVGVVGISRASHLYDPGSSPHVGWDLSISIWLRGFFSGYSGFPPSAYSTFTPRSEPSSD